MKGLLILLILAAANIKFGKYNTKNIFKYHRTHFYLWKETNALLQFTVKSSDLGESELRSYLKERSVKIT